MHKKKELIDKICRKPLPRNFTVRELESLMNQCNCIKFSGGRGSGIGFMHEETKYVLQFDQPHPGNELRIYHIKKTIQFLKNIGEIK